MKGNKMYVTMVDMQIKTEGLLEDFITLETIVDENKNSKTEKIFEWNSRMMNLIEMQKKYKITM